MPATSEKHTTLEPSALDTLVDAAFPVIYRHRKLLRPNIASKQYTDFHKHPGHARNKVLELVGDSIFALSTSMMLYDRCPDATRTFISTCQKALVCNRTLAFVGETCQIARLDTPSFYDAVEEHKTVSAPSAFDMAQVKPTADVVEMSVGALFEWDGLEACYEFVQDALSVPALEIVKVHAARQDTRGVEFNATGMVQKRHLDLCSVRDLQKNFGEYVQSQVRRKFTPENGDVPDNSKSQQLPSTTAMEVECIPGPPLRLGFHTKLPAPIQELVQAPVRKALGSITNGRDGGDLLPLPKAKQPWRSREGKRTIDSAQKDRGRYVPPAKRARVGI